MAADTANCGLKLVNTVPIVMAEEGRRALVPVIINGTQKEFLLDTGGALTQVSAAAAEELKLPIMDSNVKMLDLYGNASTKAAKVDSFVLGRLGDRNARLPLTTFQDGGRISGILAADYMGKYDIELDFAGGKMNYFSTDHCRGKVVYWPAAAIAVVPILFADMQHLVLDVSLDGHPLRAMIDTGAPGTTLYKAEARRIFGITGEDSDARFEHVFQKLSFEGLQVGNPHITIIPDKTGSKDPNNGYVTGSRVRRVDDADPTDPVMLIGMSILTKLHLYIAFSERKIYITPASAPAQTQQ
ncbi:MAG TPA: retropepsin-like aspartic protease [Rhizomicrobium sp.]|nr:retropepsin-like aspartic protease [Rhizomicrobium sp.]